MVVVTGSRINQGVDVGLDAFAALAEQQISRTFVQKSAVAQLGDVAGLNYSLRQQNAHPTEYLRQTIADQVSIATGQPSAGQSVLAALDQEAGVGAGGSPLSASSSVTAPNSNLPPVEAPYYVQPGFFASAAYKSTDLLLDSNSNPLDRLVGGLGIVALTVPTIAEEIARGFLNAPAGASVAGQYAAQAVLADTTDQKVISALSATAAIAGAFTDALAPLTMGATPIGLSESASQELEALGPNAARAGEQDYDAKSLVQYQLLKQQLANEQARDPLIGTTLPGANAPVQVTAEGSVGDQMFFDTNQTARPTQLANPAQPTLISDLIPPGNPNSSMANAHAEIGVVQQASDAGLTAGQDMTIIVRGKSVCTYCNSDLINAADAANLRSLTVVDTITGVTSRYSSSSGVSEFVTTQGVKPLP